MQQSYNTVGLRTSTEFGGAGAVFAAAAPSVIGGLGMEMARLSAQLVAQSHEMFHLQEAALRSKQVQ